MKVRGPDLTQDEMSLLLSHSNMNEPAEPFMFRGQKVSVEGAAPRRPRCCRSRREL
jgi:hypothetical protein